MKINKTVIIRMMLLLMMPNDNTDVIHIVKNCWKPNKLMLKCSSVTFAVAAGSPLSTRSLAIVDSSADKASDEASV